MTFLPAIELKKRTGKPLLVHVHTLEQDRRPEHVNEWIADLEEKAIEAADIVIPVSKYTADKIEQQHQVASHKIRAVYNGLAPVKAYKKEKSFPEKLITFVGRLAHQKGPDLFLEMATQLLQKRSDIRFALAGDGPMQLDLMTKAAQAGLGDKIHFMGFLDRKTLFDLLAITDVFVMPSRSEPFGIAALEAAHFGIPSVLSRHSGISIICYRLYIKTCAITSGKASS